MTTLANTDPNPLFGTLRALSKNRIYRAELDAAEKSERAVATLESAHVKSCGSNVFCYAMLQPIKDCSMELKTIGESLKIAFDCIIKYPSKKTAPSPETLQRLQTSQTLLSTQFDRYQCILTIVLKNIQQEHKNFQINFTTPSVSESDMIKNFQFWTNTLTTHEKNLKKLTHEIELKRGQAMSQILSTPPSASPASKSAAKKEGSPHPYSLKKLSRVYPQPSPISSSASPALSSFSQEKAPPLTDAIKREICSYLRSRGLEHRDRRAFYQEVAKQQGMTGTHSHLSEQGQIYCGTHFDEMIQLVDSFQAKKDMS